MTTIRDLRRLLQKVEINTQSVRIIEKTGSAMIKLNQDQLYKSSVDSLGVPLQLYASTAYALDKNKLNPGLPLFRPDLKLTGSFYRGFFVTAGYTGIFTIDSEDSKTAHLTDKYGIAIFGLTAANKTVYAFETFYPELQKYITGKTGLIFR